MVGAYIDADIGGNSTLVVALAGLSVSEQCFATA